MAIETVQLPNLKVPREGIYSSGQPTTEQFRQLRDEGLKAVVNLRPAGEHELDERAEVENLGMRYFEIPVGGPQDITHENARRFHEIIEDSGNQPILIHCGTGNRVGALYALKSHHFDEKDTEEAVEHGKLAGLTKLEPVVRQCLGC